MVHNFASGCPLIRRIYLESAFEAAFREIHLTSDCTFYLVSFPCELEICLDLSANAQKPTLSILSESPNFIPPQLQFSLPLRLTPALHRKPWAGRSTSSQRRRRTAPFASREFHGEGRSEGRQMLQPLYNLPFKDGAKECVSLPLTGFLHLRRMLSSKCTSRHHGHSEPAVVYIPEQSTWQRGGTPKRRSIRSELGNSSASHLVQKWNSNFDRMSHCRLISAQAVGCIQVDDAVDRLLNISFIIRGAESSEILEKESA